MKSYCLQQLKCMHKRISRLTMTKEDNSIFSYILNDFFNVSSISLWNYCICIFLICKLHCRDARYGVQETAEWLQRMHAVVLGPGLGRDPIVCLEKAKVFLLYHIDVMRIELISGKWNMYILISFIKHNSLI